jgi:hypothetical protein
MRVGDERLVVRVIAGHGIMGYVFEIHHGIIAHSK